MEDKRLVFDTISERFDQWREKYTPELFDYIIKTCYLDETKSCLEIGPGTGQASDFAIKTGCDYTAIELGSNLASVMSSKYGNYSNFKIILKLMNLVNRALMLYIQLQQFNGLTKR